MVFWLLLAYVISTTKYMYLIHTIHNEWKEFSVIELVRVFIRIMQYVKFKRYTCISILYYGYIGFVTITGNHISTWGLLNMNVSEHNALKYNRPNLIRRPGHIYHSRLCNVYRLQYDIKVAKNNKGKYSLWYIMHLFKPVSEIGMQIPLSPTPASQTDPS